MGAEEEGEEAEEEEEREGEEEGEEGEGEEEEEGEGEEEEGEEMVEATAPKPLGKTLARSAEMRQRRRRWLLSWGSGARRSRSAVARRASMLEGCRETAARRALA
jgi:hypothetical protein